MGGGKSGFGSQGHQSRKRHKVITDFEDRIRFDTKEHILVTDINGNILDEVEGEFDTVKSKLTTEQLKDTITSHNHPDIILPDGSRVEGNIFSSDDMFDSAKNDEYEWHATTTTRTYIIRRKDFNDSSKRYKFAKAYEKAWNKFKRKACNESDKAIERGEIPDTESAYARSANTLVSQYMQKWLRNHAKRYGYIFEERTK